MVMKVLVRGQYFLMENTDYLDIYKKRKWTVDANGYLRSIQTKTDKAKMFHVLVMNPPTGMVVDHISGDKRDNRRRSLRICSNAQNCRNQRRRSNNTSGYKGVSWHKGAGKWQVHIKFDYQSRYLGLYKTVEEAARAYNVAAAAMFEEYAKLNPLP